MPLVDGLNELKVTRDTDIIYINLTKVTSISGNYVKWLNQYGEWNYWLFNCIHKRNRKISDGGELNNDFNDVSETSSPFLDLGKTSQDTLTLISENVSENDQEVLNGVLDSPKVFYFVGTRYSQVNDISWLSVKSTATSNSITNYKEMLKRYKLTFELPQRYTMSL